MDSVDACLFAAMLREEMRLHRSLIGPIGSSLFPAFVFALSSAMAVAAALVFRNLRYATILLMLHAASWLYGCFVGALGHVGEQAMTRRLGQVSMLLQLPQIHPVSLGRTMGLFYLKDALFYLLYSFVPLTAGVGLAAPLVRVPLGSVALMGATMFLTFMMGMGMSFLLSALATRSKSAAAVFGLSTLGLVSAVWPFRLLEPGQLLLPLGFWWSRDQLQLVAAIIVALVLFAIAVLTIAERFDSVQERHESMLLPTESRLSFTGSMSTLLAKEWLELLRSGALAQVVTGFVGLILGVYAVVWLFESGVGVPLPFNVVSYSGFVGLVGVMAYSWMTNVENNECLNAMPVGVGRVVEAKVALYLLLTAGASAGYVALIGLARNELSLIPLGILAAEATSVYSVAVTAHLTGLWTNAMFFDARVLIRFSAAVVPPLTAIEVASLFMGGDARYMVGAVVAISLVQLSLSLPIFRGMKGKWVRRAFSFAATNQ